MYVMQPKRRLTELQLLVSLLSGTDCVWRSTAHTMGHATSLAERPYLACDCVPNPALQQAVKSSKGRVKLVRPMWVAKMTAAPKLGGWQLTGGAKDQGTYGAVVIAHNGKCANRCAVQHCLGILYGRAHGCAAARSCLLLSMLLYALAQQCTTTMTDAARHTDVYVV